jgi:hypothetical protein
MFIVLSIDVLLVDFITVVHNIRHKLYPGDISIYEWKEISYICVKHFKSSLLCMLESVTK